MARVSLGICHHNTQKLQNPPHVTSREGKGARAKGKTTGERERTAEATQKQREGGSGKQGRTRTNRSRTGANGRGSVDRSLEHATREELAREGGFAALVDSANVASWLRGTRVMGDSCGAENREARKNHGNPGGTVNASGLRTLRHGVGLQDTKRAECSC